MVGIGINENVTLDKVEILDKEGQVSIDFTFSDGIKGDDMFDEQYDENGMIITADGPRTIKLWPLKAPKETKTDGTTVTMAQRIDESFKATQEYQNFFTQLARCYVTGDKIKGAFDRFRGLPVNKDNKTSLLDDAVLLGVTTNLTNQFIALCGEFFGKPGNELRLLLRRQSAAKAFPTFRDKFLQDQTFVERMDVPKASSAIAWMKYEITKGLNSSVPAPTDTDPIPAVTVDANTLFGGAPVPPSNEEGIPEPAPVADLSQIPGLNS
jgi:hypothetical protein